MVPLANIFQPLITVFEKVLVFFHGIVGGSWGWSIVLLTVVIRAVLVPLTVKQFRSMQRLQALQPQLKALQAKYKDDKQRQQQEMMKFYKENQVNPFGSCLPLVAQLPVFISLFYMLRSTLRHDICPNLNPLHAAHTVPCGPHGGAGFLFISDLTNSATGATLIVLIVLYIATMLGSSLMMSNPTMDRNQRLMMMFLPLIFVLFIIRFPAGVILYWITTNLWTIAQQYVVKRSIGPATPPASTGGDESGPGGGGPSPDGNGAGGGGLSGLLRGKLGEASTASRKSRVPAAVGAGSSSRSSAPPPPPPRKKKKRSGRRR